MQDKRDRSAELDGLSGKMARGVAWMALLKLCVRSLAIVSTLILVRLLEPSDFGLVAMAMFFIAILETLSWFSFDVVLIQKQSSSRVHYDTAWTFNVLFRVVSALVLVAIAKPVAGFYSEPQVEMILYVLAGGVLVTGFENIGVVDFRKQLDFRKDMLFMASKKLATFMITIPLAFALKNYWALVIGAAAGRVLGVVISYVVSPYRPRFNLAAREELFDFSKWLFLNNLMGGIRLRLAEPVIGRIGGAAPLGLFNVSYEISNTPTTELVAPINRAVFPGYAKMSHDLRVLGQGYVNVISVIALAAIPAGAGIAAVAEWLVPVVLGERWISTIPLIAILAWYGVISALQTNIASVFYALGRPRVLTFLLGLQLVVLLVAAIPATQHFGATGAAWAYVGSALLLMPISFGVTLSALSLSPWRLIAVLWRPLIGAALMFYAVRGLIAALGPDGGAMGLAVGLIIAVIAGVVTYCALIWVAWVVSGRPEGAESYVLDKVLPAVRRRVFSRAAR